MTANERSEHLRLELDLLEGAIETKPGRRASSDGGEPPTLIVSADADLRAYIVRCIQSERHPCPDLIEASRGDTALRILARGAVGLVVAEADLQGVTGTDLCRWLLRSDGAAPPPIVLIVDRPLRREEFELHRAAGAAAVLTKPFNQTKLCDVLRTVRRAGARDPPPSAR